MSQPTKDALVLGGGGAKGSFQAGAVGYLYRLQNLAPAVITGTSVGAVNGMKLAEGTVHDDVMGHFGSPLATQGLAGLEVIWLGMQEDGDMYGPTAAYSALPLDIQKDLADGLKTHLTSLANEYLAGTITTAEWGPLGLLVNIDIGVKISDLKDELQALADGQSLYQLKPIGALYDSHIDASRVQASGIDFLFAMTGLDSGELRYVHYDRAASDEQGKAVGTLVVASDLGTPLDQMAMRDAVLASAADPIFLAPQAVDGDLYVDGGVREVVPLRAALELGANRIFAVLCDVPMAPEDRSKHNDLAGIALRCLAIAIDEVERGDLEPIWPDPYERFEIRPSFEVHDAFTIDEALIRINLDHGYMSAFDAVDGRVRSETRRALLRDRAARIADLRVQCQKLEKMVDEEHPGTFSYVTAESMLSQIQPLKSQIRELTESRLRLAGQYASRPDWTLAWPSPGSATTVTPSRPWDQLEAGTLWSRNESKQIRHQSWGVLWPNGYSDVGDPALDGDALVDERHWWIESQGTTGWCFQSSTGTQGDFELLVPVDDGGNIALAHFTRQNDKSMAWVRNADAIPVKKGKLKTISPVPISVSTFQGNYGSPPNFEAVVRLRPAAVKQPDLLGGLWFDHNARVWHSYDIEVDGKPIAVAGDPVVFQSTLGTQGDFELLVPVNEGGKIVLAHYTRRNDQGGTWVRQPDAIPVKGGKAKTLTPTPISVSAFQGNYGAPPRFEAVVRMRAAKAGADFLVGLTYDPILRSWKTYDIKLSGSSITVAGDPFMFQSTAGRQGNFELLVPVADDSGTVHLAHYTRMNDLKEIWSENTWAFGAPPQAASAGSRLQEIEKAPPPVRLGGGSAPTRTGVLSPPPVHLALAETPVSVTAFQGNYGTPPSLFPTGGQADRVSAHTNFEGIVRARTVLGADFLVGIWYDPSVPAWHSYDIKVGGKPIEWGALPS